jgi:DNA-binding CsgD family transcriptional regulator
MAASAACCEVPAIGVRLLGYREWVVRCQLIGRAFEVALLDSALRAVIDGRGGVLHIVGEAGAGKTTLLDVVHCEATAAGLQVHTTTIDESDQRRRLACSIRLLPSLATVRQGDPVGAALAAMDAFGTTPTVMLVDDLQWADSASADVLAVIARRAEDLGVLLVTTARTHPGCRDLVGFENAVDRCGQRLTLGALSVDEVADLAEFTLGSPPDLPLAHLLLGASGNPFLTVELLRGLERDGALSSVDGSLHVAPGTALPSALGARLAREAIAESGKDSLLIRSAAVFSGGFTAEELAAVIDRSTVEVLADLLALAEAKVLTERDARLVFRHDIIRQAVVESTPAPLVRSLNRRAAAVLAAAGADRTRVASCLLAAADVVDPRDVSTLIDLGLELSEEGSYAAADVLETALRGLDRQDARFVDVVLALGWALADVGRLAEVPVLLDVLGDRDRDRLDVRRLRGHALSLQGKLAQEFTPLPDDFDIDASFDQIDAAAVDLVAELSTLEMISGRVDRAQRLAEWVRASGVPVSPTGELHLCMTVAWLHGREGTFEAGLEVAERGMALATRLVAHDSSRVTPTSIAAIMLDSMGRGDEALHLLRVAQDAPGPRWTRPLLQFGAAVTLYRRGKWDDALAEVAAGLASADEYGVKLGTAWPHALQVLISTARGDYTTARSWLDRARAEVPPASLGIEWLMHASAIVAEADGDQQGALDILRPTVEIALALRAPAVLMNLSPDTARLASTLGDRSSLAMVVDSLEALTGKTRSPVVHAFHDWATGWQRSDFTLVERAGLAAASYGRYAEHARAHHDASVIAAAAGELVDARRLAGVAFTGYEALRAQHLHARLRAELRARDLPMRPRRSPPRPTIGWEALTDTESQIVDLVGDGLANGTIAEQLFVSRRTVESHLARVYQKLGFTRRAELVVGVREHRGTTAHEST